MGTKVHCKSYLPGYYSMRNINEDTNSSWPQYYEDRTLNGQLCNGFTPRPFDEYLDYDKEVLKQTMLRHEEIFRKQVLELHRLYKKQRDLMEELKRNEEQKFSIQVKSSQSSPFSTQVLPKGVEKSWQVHGFPSMGASCSRTPISGVDDSKTHLTSLNGRSFQAGLMVREKGTSQVNHLLGSRVKKLPRKMLDLELPAEAYLDNEDDAEDKNVIKPLLESTDTGKRNSSLQPKNDVKLTIGTAQDRCSGDENQKSSPDLQNGLQPGNLADLNEPLKDVSCEEMSYSQCPQGHQKSMESLSSFRCLQKDLFQHRCNGGDGSVSINMERSEEGQKRPFLNNAFGQSSSHVNSFASSLSNKNGRPLSEPVLINPSQAQDFLPVFPPMQYKAGSWFGEKQHQSIESSDRSHHTANKAFPGLTIPSMSSPLYAPPLIDCDKTAYPAVSSWKKPSNSTNHMPVAVQPFMWFDACSPMNIQSTPSHHLENAPERWQCNRRTNCGDEKHFYSNGYCHAFQFESTAASSVHLSPISFNKPNLNNGASTSCEKSEIHGHQMPLNGLHCMDVKTEKGMNLNIAPPNGFQNGLAPEPRMLSDVESTKEGLSGGIPWLRTKSPCSEPIRTDKGVLQKLASVQGHGKVMLSYCTSAREVEQKTETEASSSLEVLQDPPLVVKPKGTEIHQNGVAATSSNRRILGFPVPQRLQHADISHTAVLHKKNSLDDEVKNRTKEGLHSADSHNHSKPLDLEKQIHMELVPEKGTAEAVNCFRCDINLNCSAASLDQLKSSESSSEDEIELPSPPSLRGKATRFAPEIDLEAPPASLEEEEAPSSEPAPPIDQLGQLVEPESRKESPQGTENTDEALVMMAAETIRIFSLDYRTIHVEEENDACHPSPLASFETLCWFADLVSSNGDDNVGTAEVPMCDENSDRGSSDIEGMDYFEYMTMNLTETIIDEHYCRPMEAENSDEEETGVAHLLLARPRRGQARRRRQRRDFQRDILPGLASLSRQEVTEDLQMIGGMTRASGRPGKAGGTRRNAARTQARRPARGGRRPRSTPAAAAPGGPQPGQPSKEEAAMDGRSILGWGRTTKRCRRQRCPPPSGNILLPPPS